MIKYKQFILGLVFLSVIPGTCNASALQAISGNRIVVIAPARQRIVQLGFDLSALRPRLLLITYQGTAADDNAGMHLWNGRKWLRLRDADFEAGAFLKTGTIVRRIFLLGSEETVPWILQYPPAWTEEMQWIQSLHIPDLVNVMGPELRFTREEWIWIAGLHDLRLFETTVRHRQVQRAETWPTPTPEEARLPLLERARRGLPAPSATPPESVRIERQPWVEVPVKPLPSAKAPPPKLPAVPPDPEPLPPPLPLTVEPFAPDPVLPELPETPSVEPEPSAPDPDLTVDEPGDAAPLDLPSPDVPREQIAGDDIEGTTDLTPEEIKFFEMIRKEFPELDYLPSIP